MKEDNRKQLKEKMAGNLPALRAMLHISQEELAGLLGMSRQQVVAIEGRKREMTWHMFLALVLIFMSNKETSPMLSHMDVYTEELRDFLGKYGEKRNLE